MPIKNYTTKVAAVQTVGEIQGILASHGARKVMMDYDACGKVTALTFTLQTPGGMCGFTLAARPDGVKSALSKQRVKVDDAQAERVAWRNVKDWIDAQIALIESEQATVDELFLHRMLNSEGKTLYALYAANQLALGDGGGSLNE